MRLLTVAERELRAAARHRGLYRIRWLAAAGALVFLIWLGWASDALENRNAGPEVFQVFSVAIFIYCLFVGAAGTADAISREKRDGTLGLLFLTNLNSAEIVAGKFAAHALALVYSLLAMFPVLALPVLFGGIEFGHFGRVVLALANALFFALATGFLASALCVRQFPAISLATGLTLVWTLGLVGVTEVLRRYGLSRSTAETVAMFSPLHTLLSANENMRMVKPSQFWFSLATVAGVAVAWLALVAWRLQVTWRDRPKSVSRWRRFEFGERLRARGRNARAALRRRLLAINPYFWLAGRQRVSAPVFMLLVVVLVLVTAGVTAPYFGRVMGAGVVSPMVGSLFAWLWTGLAIHALVLYYGAMAASQRLAEDKQAGALELILTTPTSERPIARGLWLAYGRRMFFPILAAVLVHAWFVWQCAETFVLDHPGRLPSDTTAGQLIWASLFDQPIRGFRPEWVMGFAFRTLGLILVALAANWIMLGWLGRWLGLRMKRPGFAPLVALALAVVPPTLIFSLVCYVAAESNLFRQSERQVMPMLMWLGFGIVLGNCLLLSAWAAGRLRRDFRTTVASHYEPVAAINWWRTGWRLVRRFAIGATAFALLLGLLMVLFYGYQNWRSQRQWTGFQKELQQRGESLALVTYLPGSVADDENFAQSPAFRNFLNRKPTNAVAAVVLRESLNHAKVDQGGRPLTPWMQQGFLHLGVYAAWADPKLVQGRGRGRRQLALNVELSLEPLHPDLNGLAAARQPSFQATTNRDASAVLASNLRELAGLEQLHFLFQLRASARLALDRAEEAGDDVLTSLRLAQLARQSPDVKSALRVQTLLVRSVQPIWEGLREHRWAESQLVAFQSELGRFDLLTDYTNAVGRVVRAYVETWQVLPEADGKRTSVPRGGGVYVRRSEWAWQPRAWWYDRCIQLHRAGQNAIGRVDFGSRRVIADFNWDDLSGLVLDSDSTELLRQSPWMGNQPSQVAFAQTAVNQAILACALERWRLARGTYPETLDQLLPDYLDAIPPDISRGRPLFYERADDHQYTLRAAGPNGTIETGKPVSDDWLWSFTALTNLPAGPRPLQR